MGLKEPTIYVATPSFDGTVVLPWATGCMEALQQFSGRIRIDAQCGSFLPRNRDVLTAKFLESGCSHMMCADADIGWHATDLQKLLDTGKWFVSGVYAKKQPDRAIPAEFTEIREPPLVRCVYVPAGFVLLARPVVTAMIDAYPDLRYEHNGLKMSALWTPNFQAGGSYDGEDVAFCRRWTAIGGEIWMHMGVVVRHIGPHVFLPDVTTASESLAKAAE